MTGYQKKKDAQKHEATHNPKGSVQTKDDFLEQTAEQQRDSGIRIVSTLSNDCGSRQCNVKAASTRSEFAHAVDEYDRTAM